MLTGINPLLTGAILADLDTMGHGDRLLLADGNYPAGVSSRPTHRSGATTLDALTAILSVFPVDSATAVAVRTDRDGDEFNPLQLQAIELAQQFGSIEFSRPDRVAFRALASSASVVVLTTDYLPSCYVFTKGVVLPS